MESIIQGSAFCCGNNITAYQIIAQNRWALGLDAEELGKWAMEEAYPKVLNVENGFKSRGSHYEHDHTHQELNSKLHIPNLIARPQQEAFVHCSFLLGRFDLMLFYK